MCCLEPVAVMESSAIFWISNHPIALWLSTLARPPDPRSSAICLPSGSWWRTSVTWLISCLYTLMKLTHQMAGRRLRWAPARSTSESIRTWKRDSGQRVNSSTTFLYRRSVSWWPTAWTTMLMLPTVFPMNGCVLYSRGRLCTLGGKGLFFTT